MVFALLAEVRRGEGVLCRMRHRPSLFVCAGSSRGSLLAAVWVLDGWLFEDFWGQINVWWLVQGVDVLVASDEAMFCCFFFVVVEGCVARREVEEIGALSRIVLMNRPPSPPGCCC